MTTESAADTRVEELNSLVQEAMERLQIPGVVVGITNRDEDLMRVRSSGRVIEACLLPIVLHSGRDI